MITILQKIAKGEHEQQDFKMRIDSAVKIAKTLSAFANTSGGSLLIGVKDNGKISGIDPEEEAHMVEAAADMYCKPRIEINYFTHITDNGKKILEAIVHKGNKPPYFAKDENNNWIAYLRKDDENIIAGGFILSVWSTKKTIKPNVYAHTEKEQKIFSALNEFPGMGLNALQKHVRINRTYLFKTLSKLISWDLISFKITNGKIALYLNQ